jgi:hypothetical protein
MRHIIITAAISIIALGPASAKCTLDGLSGQWVFDVGVPVGNAVYNAQCNGIVESNGKFVSSACQFMVRGNDVELKLNLTTTTSCRLSGTAKLTFTEMEDPDTITMEIKGFIGSAGNGIMAVGLVPPEETTWVGYLKGMRTGT